MTYNSHKTRNAFVLAVVITAGMAWTTLVLQPNDSAEAALQPREKVATESRADIHAVNRPAVLHKNVKIDGLDIFYREAGPKDAPTVLLLHGFPTSSHMFRHLIPALADRYHVIASDYPGYGK